jgi:hypothetical protein
MANFSSFFPIASGGGGFTKMKKYSTAIALNDTTDRLNALRNNSGTLVTDNSAGTVFHLIYDQPAQSIAAAPSTYTIKNLRFDSSTALNVGAVIPANFFAGGTVRFSYSGVNNVNLQQPSVISSHPEFTYVNSNSSLVLSYSTNPQGAYSASARNNLGTGDTIPLTLTTSITVNPATDLGLADGDSLGYFMCGGGTVGPSNSLTSTGYGGRIIYGTEIIANASTDLVLTPGVGENQVCVSNSLTVTAMTESTITGGLTLSTANGSRQAGFRTETSNGNGTPGSGVNGYGVGGGGRGYNDGSEAHGWGGGTRQSANVGGYPPSNFNFQAGDGAILLYY